MPRSPPWHSRLLYSREWQPAPLPSFQATSSASSLQQTVGPLLVPSPRNPSRLTPSPAQRASVSGHTTAKPAPHSSCSPTTNRATPSCASSRATKPGTTPSSASLASPVPVVAALTCGSRTPNYGNECITRTANGSASPFERAPCVSDSRSQDFVRPASALARALLTSPPIR